MKNNWRKRWKRCEEPVKELLAAIVAGIPSASDGHGRYLLPGQTLQRPLAGAETGEAVARKTCGSCRQDIIEWKTQALRAEAASFCPASCWTKQASAGSDWFAFDISRMGIEDQSGSLSESGWRMW